MAGYIGTQAVSVNTTSATISDDLSVGDDLTVTDDAAIGGTALVTGVLTTTAATVHTNGITMPDGAIAKFGTDDDLQISHINGTGSLIRQGGEGNLFIQASSSIVFGAGDGSETLATFTDDGACTLNFNNEAKIATKATGVTVTGEMAATTMDLSSNAVIDGTLSVGGTVDISGAIVHTGDTNTFISFNAADQIQLVTGGAERVAFYNDETHFNDGHVDMDFIVESDGNANMLHVNGANNSVGIGRAGGDAPLDINGGTFTSPTIQMGNHGDNCMIASKFSLNIKADSTDAIGGRAIGFNVGTSATFDMNDASGSTFNNSALAALDFNVESAGNANMLSVDSSANIVGIGRFSNTSGAAVIGSYFSQGASNHFHQVIANTSTTTSHACLFINRQSVDNGVSIAFMHANAEEGTITVNGSTVALNGFSGRHESSGIPENTPVGTVVSTIDELDVYPDRTTDTDGNAIDHLKAGQTRADHAQVEVSTSEGDVCVYGVVGQFNNDGKLLVTSLGIGSVRVTGACDKGDLLESNGDGTAKVQSDDIVRSKTLGKVTIGNSNTGVKLVSCVMYCG